MFKQENEKIRQQLLQLVKHVPDEVLNRKPSPEEWSPIQILEHLHLMEQTVAAGIAQQLENEQSRKAGKKPIKLATVRLVKVDAPSYLVPSEEFISYEEMEGRLAASREKLHHLYDSVPQEVLEQKSMPHIVFGNMPLIQWFSFIGLHEKRHLKQLEKALSKVNDNQKK
ncbi:DinB family protein [Planococcus salinus]|uniref:DinB family protein n=1 Tax=Planococcus salinus TaxID=1848460 RepID=A0A3M8PE17_9BACL|nr:DinB family protein [Planococcus salinus]RNF41124.1 DinB family protein [Planococcus salinus]